MIIINSRWECVGPLDVTSSPEKLPKPYPKIQRRNDSRSESTKPIPLCLVIPTCKKMYSKRRFTTGGAFPSSRNWISEIALTFRSRIEASRTAISLLGSSKNQQSNSISACPGRPITVSAINRIKKMEKAGLCIRERSIKTAQASKRTKQSV